MEGMEKKAPHMLSGGQKQRIAIAGVLAVDPQILVFDEATTMLDTKGRKEVLAVMQQLHEAGKTVFYVTHFVEEAVMADRVLLFHRGRIVRDGTPQEVLTETEALLHAGLTPPLSVRLYEDLKAQGIELPCCPLTIEELVEQICQFE